MAINFCDCAALLFYFDTSLALAQQGYDDGHARCEDIDNVHLVDLFMSIFKRLNMISHRYIFKPDFRLGASPHRIGGSV